MNDMANRCVREGGSTLWVLRNKHGRIVQCIAHLARAGVELEILSDGTSLITRRLASGPEAIAWAEDVRMFLDVNAGRPANHLRAMP
jgi:hypothetical protein